jgi:hypothetical protein
MTLKALYVWYSSKSNFPAIMNPEFAVFVAEFKLKEGKVTQQILENNFISAHSGMQGVEGTVELALIRFQFMELLVRLATSKYKDTGKTKLHSEAF